MLGCIATLQHVQAANRACAELAVTVTEWPYQLNVTNASYIA